MVDSTVTPDVLADLTNATPEGVALFLLHTYAIKTEKSLFYSNNKRGFEGNYDEYTALKKEYELLLTMIYRARIST